MVMASHHLSGSFCPRCARYCCVPTAQERDVLADKQLATEVPSWMHAGCGHGPGLGQPATEVCYIWGRGKGIQEIRVTQRMPCSWPDFPSASMMQSFSKALYMDTAVSAIILLGRWFALPGVQSELSAPNAAICPRPKPNQSQ